MGWVRIPPTPTRPTGWALVLLGFSVVLANWLTEWTSFRHLPEGHGPFYSMLAAVVAISGLGVLTKGQI